MNLIIEMKIVRLKGVTIDEITLDFRALKAITVVLLEI